MGWMHLTYTVLRNQFKEVVGETLLALQQTGEETATADNQDTPERGKRSTKFKLPKIMDDPGWLSFPIPTSWNSGLASDIKYNRELIEVLQQTSSGTLDELAGLTNRTELAIDRADKLTWDLLQNVRNLNIGQNDTRQQVKKLTREIDGMGVTALEDKLGEILYLQSLIRQAYVFRKGIQHLTRGQLTMDLVPREYVSNAVGVVNRYLQRTYS